MWFKFPDGAETVSIERQIFKPEVTSPSGARLFRAPDHFAPIVRTLPGFGIALPEEIPEDAPEDLPRVDPLRDGAIAEQASRLSVLEIEVEGLRTDLSACNAARAAALHERDNLKLELHEAKVKISDLEDELEELREAASVKSTVKK